MVRRSVSLWMLLFGLGCGVVLRMVPLALAAHSTLEERFDAEGELYSVVFEHGGPLGVQFDSNLRVMGFKRAPRVARRGKTLEDEEVPLSEPNEVMLPAEESGWVRPGDVLVSINERGVYTLQDASRELGRAEPPLEIVFRAPIGSNRTEEMRALMSEAGGIRGLRGEMRLSRSGDILARVPFALGRIGGPVTCRLPELSLVWAEPRHGCGAYALSGMAVGRAVMVNRGDCAFPAKALNAQDQGAALLVVANDGPDLFPIPRPESKKERVDIPVVLIGSVGVEAVRMALHDASHKPLEVTFRLEGQYCGPALPGSAEYEIQAERKRAALAKAAEEENLKRRQSAASGKFEASSLVSNVSGEFITAEWTTSLPEDPMPLIYAPGDGTLCPSSDETEAAVLRQFMRSTPKDCAVLAYRGRCSFAEKARTAASTNIKFLLLSSHDTALPVAMRLGPASVPDAPPAAMIAASAARRIVGANASVLLIRGDATVHVHWKQVAEVANPENWPTQPKARRKLYLSLSKVHHPDKPTGSQDRFDYIHAAYHSAGADGRTRGDAPLIKTATAYVITADQ